MDTNNNGQAPATDDQELAQVLAGMNQQVAGDGMQFEETGAAATDTAADGSVPAVPTEPTLPTPEEPVPAEATPEAVSEPTIIPDPLASVEPVTEPVPDAPTVASPELEAIKKDALEQLRPLVDKLDLPAQEKFDTLLLIIRSTDDQSLLTAANDAAKLIDDEAKRAEALLDVIKEIDFFTHPQA